MIFCNMLYKQTGTKSQLLPFLILVAIFSLTTVSCRPKPIKINVESAPSKLVVFSHVVPEKSMIVSLTRTFSALDGFTADSIASVLVSGATVKVRFNNEEFDFIEINPGIYVSYNEAYQVNQEYELLIIHDSDTVTAKTTMLPKVDFTVCNPEVIKQPADTAVFLNLSFTDFANTSNWYMINVYKKNEGYNPLDGVNFFENGNNGSLTTILVSDKEFGSTYEKRLELKNTFHDDSIAVTVSNINEKYFDYLKYRSTGGNILTQLNLEPINYPTNVTNGYGFFNAHFPDIRLFDLSQF